MTIGYADLDEKLADASSVVHGGRLDTNDILTTDEGIFGCCAVWEDMHLLNYWYERR